MILRGIKRTALLAGLGLTAACMAPLPGGENGPFAPGNTLTFFYQGVLTDPPEQAVLTACENELVARTCVRQSNGAVFPLEVTDTGAVRYGNETVQVILQLDPAGVPSGIGQQTNVETGETNGMRWVSLPS
ncbi:hypothetical protein [Pseudooctadecabacter sp.]|uniref:hypothetical protein n=1 Tax=Pseudooctadecabacter sp. TaxID=1966338 RepID=UPI0035C81805